MKTLFNKIVIEFLVATLVITLFPSFTLKASAATAKNETIWQGATIDMGTGYKEEGDTIVKAGCISACVYVYDEGTNLRLHITNEFGTKPLKLTHIYVARVRKADEVIMPSTLTELTVGGSKGVTVPAGGSVWTDYGKISFQYNNKIEYFLFSNESFNLKTMCGEFRHIKRFNQNDPDKLFNNYRPQKAELLNYGFCGIPFMDNIQTRTAKRKSAFLFFGDSQTTMSFPERVGDRLKSMDMTDTVLLTDAIAGNALTHDSIYARHGSKGIDRFKAFLDRYSDYDIKGVFIMIGSNDILFSGRYAIGKEVTTDQSLESAYQEMIRLCHRSGIKVYMGTIIPFKNSINSSDRALALRETINTWIRSNADLDGIVDPGVMLRDMNDRECLADAFDSGDHIHQNDLGDQVIAGAIPLSWIIE